MNIKSKLGMGGGRGHTLTDADRSKGGKRSHQGVGRTNKSSSGSSTNR